jgi:hypothetical protein
LLISIARLHAGMRTSVTQQLTQSKPHLYRRSPQKRHGRSNESAPSYTLHVAGTGREVTAAIPSRLCPFILHSKGFRSLCCGSALEHNQCEWHMEYFSGRYPFLAKCRYASKPRRSLLSSQHQSLLSSLPQSLNSIVMPLCCLAICSG